MESLALTVEEMINVRRVLVKAEMEKFLQSKELYSGLRKGKVSALGGGVGAILWGLCMKPACPLPCHGPRGSWLSFPLADLLLLQDQVCSLLLAPHLPLLQEVSCLWALAGGGAALWREPTQHRTLGG